MSQSEFVAPLYWYKATLRKITDGDTVRCDIDLGLEVVIQNQVIRLAGIDAPEMRGESLEQGRASKLFLLGLLPSIGSTIYLHTHFDRRGTFDRLLADIYTEDGVNVNQRMVEEGYAKEWAPH